MEMNELLKPKGQKEQKKDMLKAIIVVVLLALVLGFAMRTVEAIQNLWREKEYLGSVWHILKMAALGFVLIFFGLKGYNMEKKGKGWKKTWNEDNPKENNRD